MNNILIPIKTKKWENKKCGADMSGKQNQMRLNINLKSFVVNWRNSNCWASN